MANRIGPACTGIGNQRAWAGKSKNTVEIADLLLGLISGQKTCPAARFVIPNGFHKIFPHFHAGGRCAYGRFHASKSALATRIQQTGFIERLARGWNEKARRPAQLGHLILGTARNFGQAGLRAVCDAASLDGNLGDRPTGGFSQQNGIPCR